MVKSQEPKAKPDLGETSGFTGSLAIPDPNPSHAGDQVMEAETGVVGDSTAKVSMSEEPGAGKPLAGIFAGVIG